LFTFPFLATLSDHFTNSEYCLQTGTNSYSPSYSSWRGKWRNPWQTLECVKKHLEAVYSLQANILPRRIITTRAWWRGYHDCKLAAEANAVSVRWRIILAYKSKMGKYSGKCISFSFWGNLEKS